MVGQRWLATAAVAAAVAALGLGSRGVPAATANTISLSKGMHLVSGPDGTVFRGAVGNLYTLDSRGQAYTAVAPDQPAKAGVGYFAYFDGLAVVRMGADEHNAMQITLPAGTWQLVGNPSAYSSASIEGADVAYLYDQDGGYLIESSIPPGHGALVYSASGATITIRPIPGGIDTTVSMLTDKLVDNSLTTADMPPGFAITRADTNGGNNANIPATFVEEFRPITAPKATDAVQTAFISINIQQCKDADYATTLFKGTTAAVIKGALGANAQSTDPATLTATMGDDAKVFLTKVVNPTNNAATAFYTLYFRRNELYVAVITAAPFGKEDLDLTQAIAQAQDAKLAAAFP